MMFRRKYCIYEVDNFMVGFYDNKTEISLQKRFFFKFMAKRYQRKMTRLMSPLSDYLSYELLELNPNETFMEACIRVDKAVGYHV
jgi:hypothetical protein